MITDSRFFVESMLIPHSYKAIFKKIKGGMKTPNYAVICKTYREKTENSFQNDIPKIREFTNYTNEDFLRNVIFLKQAQNFGKLAKDAIIEVKPLLLYYAENQLFAFFIHSIFHFDGPSRGHGLSMIGTDLDDIGIEFQKSGFFQRIVNSYSILNAPGIFSSLKINGQGGVDEIGTQYSITKTPTITLSELIELKDNSKPGPDGYILDQFDFLFLFLASSLARYKPDLWHLIVNGENGNQIAYFKQSFSRFEKLWDRLLHTLYSLYHGSAPYALHEMDIERKELDYNIE